MEHELTFLDFIGLVVGGDAKRIEANQRKGQWAFNQLDGVRPDLASKVFRNGKDVDPFYDDAKLEAFWVFVGENW